LSLDRVESRAGRSAAAAQTRLRLALVSAHGSPLAALGGKETGGLNVYVGEISRALARLGVAVDIFSRRRDAAAPDVRALAPGVRLIEIAAGPAAELDKNEVFWHLSEFVLNVLQFAEREGRAYNLIYSHYWLSGGVGRLLQSRWGVPHATMFHTTGLVKNLARVGEGEKPLRIETERKIVARADRVIAASPHDRAQLLRHYRAPAERVEVVPCGVDLDQFRPRDRDAARAALGLGPGKVALFVGRPDPVKGLEIFFGALGELEERDQVRAVVVGGEDEAALAPFRARAAALGIAERVRFDGAQPHERLPLYYNAADVCVVPSYVETFGLVAVEAMACGTPVIAARVGGLISSVRDGETGFLIPWRCPGPFAERLEILLGNDALRARFAEACRPAVTRFAWPAVAETLLGVFERLLAAPARAVAGGAPIPLGGRVAYGLACHLFPL
jgi:D-inositol-3-phosphate glycosyltransferase